MTPDEWILCGDTGISSQTIWAVMVGVVNGKNLPTRFRFDVPHDPADFGRCFRLLLRFPEWKGRLNEVAEAFPKWRPMVENWGRMSEVYLRDLATGKSRELFDLMVELEEEGRRLEKESGDGGKQV